MKKYAQENKVIDLSTLPPCRSVLKLHTERANTVAAIWKRPVIAVVEVPELTQCGWTREGEVRWIEEEFPDELEDILLDQNYDEDAFETDDEGKSGNDDD